MTKPTHGIPATLEKLAVPIDEIHPFPGNPRRGNVGVITDSLRRNGQYRPVVVNKRTGDILAGNHTWQAAKALDWSHLAATYVDADPDQAARIVAADNRTADLGDYDSEELTDLLQLLDGDLEGTGYTDADLEKLLEDVPDSADAYTDDPGGYAEQYGVIVVCTNEAEQQAAYDKLSTEYDNVRVVTT